MTRTFEKLDRKWGRKINWFLAWFLPFWILCSVGNVITGLVWPHMGTWYALGSGFIIGTISAVITIKFLKPVTARIEKWLEGKPSGDGQKI